MSSYKMNPTSKNRETGIRTNNLFPCYLYRLGGEEQKANINAHWHDEAELLYTNCRGRAEIDGKAIPFAKGDFLCINKEQFHLLQAETNGYVYAVVFDYSFLEFKYSDLCQIDLLERLKSKKLWLPSRITSQSPSYQAVRDAFLDIIEIYGSNLVGKELKIKCDLLLFLFYLYREHMLEEASVTGQFDSIKAAITYMEEHYFEQIAVDRLAREASLSKSHFIRLFKQSTGITPIHYLRDLRLEASAACLRLGDSVTETALLCGFNNISYYIRSFREKYNQSPREYQKMAW